MIQHRTILGTSPGIGDTGSVYISMVLVLLGALKRLFTTSSLELFQRKLPNEAGRPVTAIRFLVEKIFWGVWARFDKGWHGGVYRQDDLHVIYAMTEIGPACS